LAPVARLDVRRALSAINAIGDVFFTDNTMMTMRNNDEVSANWAKFTDAKKDQIRGDCKKFATSTDVCTRIAGH
jgi:hypothetical protein